MDIFLNRDTHDIVVGNYDLPVVRGVDLIRQRIKQRLLTILGEWFLDIEIGIPWFEQIIRKGPDRAEVEGNLIRTISETQGVIEITEFNLDFQSPQRILIVQFRARVEQGEEIDMEVTV